MATIFYHIPLSNGKSCKISYPCRAKELNRLPVEALIKFAKTINAPIKTALIVAILKRQDKGNCQFSSKYRK